METILTLIEGFLKLLAALLVLGLSSERGTELLKVFWNSITAAFPVVSLQNKRSFLFAAVVAFFITYFFNIDITQYLKVLDGFDPNLIQLVNALLITLISNKAHDAIGGASG